MPYHITHIIILISFLSLTVLGFNQNNNDISFKLKRDEHTLNYYYSLLDSDEKSFYDELKNKLEQGLKSQHSLYDFDLEEVAFSKKNDTANTSYKIIKAFKLDNPKYFWLQNYHRIIKTRDNIVTGITLKFEREYSENQLIGMLSAINENINNLIQEINELTTYCQKLKRIHDYLIKDIKYTEGEELSRYNIYGALVDHACVCEGYAESFMYICQQVGINSIILEGEDHEWNLVQMENGQWYGMDVTFDDPSINGVINNSGDDSNISYQYFLAGINTPVNNGYSDTTFGASTVHQIYMNIYGFDVFPTVSQNAYDCSQETLKRCGGEYGRCPAGQCCSKNGYCGTSSLFCAPSQGCQSAYGDCKCGGENGSCPAGQCCSKNGYCGTTKAYCSADRCQSKFGDCKCGNDFGKCSAGQCCSKKGYCGTTKAYCSADRCQSEFGDCKCGNDFGKCSAGQCCSKKGYCGKTNAYCYSSNGCQAKFGDCRCGSNMGSCSNYCCSSKGYCGTTANHCSFSKGCQSSFGDCRCGKDFGKCEAGLCCSSKGYCGKSAAYCSTTKGCNSYYGDCKCGEGFGSCASKECCSKKGYCGTTINHCALSKGSLCNYGQCDIDL